MIDLSDLPHWLILNRVVQAGARGYGGQRAVTREEVRYPCFYDGTRKKVKDLQSGDTIEVSGIIFLHPSNPISLRDELVRVESGGGGIINERAMRVMSANPACDDEGVHHIEVFLMNDNAVS